MNFKIDETDSAIINDLANKLGIGHGDIINFFIKRGMEQCLASQDTLLDMNSMRNSINNNPQARAISALMWDNYSRGMQKQSNIKPN